MVIINSNKAFTFAPITISAGDGRGHGQANRVVGRDDEG